MARKPNYRFERSQRERLKAEKKEKKEEKKRQQRTDTGEEQPAAPEQAGSDGAESDS